MRLSSVMAKLRDPELCKANAFTSTRGDGGLQGTASSSDTPETALAKGLCGWRLPEADHKTKRGLQEVMGDDVCDIKQRGSSPG